jgi:hypothetical protein
LYPRQYGVQVIVKAVPSRGSGQALSLLQGRSRSSSIPESRIVVLTGWPSKSLTIATAPNTSVCKWEVPLALKPGSDYTIQVKTSTNASLSDTSDAVFTIN